MNILCKIGQRQQSNSISNVENALAFKASLFAAITLLDAELTVLVAASRMVHSAKSEALNARNVVSALTVLAFSSML